jgi:hypothetical protein
LYGSEASHHFCNVGGPDGALVSFDVEDSMIAALESLDGAPAPARAREDEDAPDEGVPPAAILPAVDKGNGGTIDVERSLLPPPTGDDVAAAGVAVPLLARPPTADPAAPPPLLTAPDDAAVGAGVGAVAAACSAARRP